MEYSTTWTDIKNKATANTWTKYYIDQTGDSDELTAYLVVVGNSSNQFYSCLFDSDKTDFTDNHKSSATLVTSFTEALALII